MSAFCQGRTNRGHRIKGAAYRTNDDSKEKDLIGKLWASRSGGRCVFELVGKDDMEMRLDKALAPTKNT